MKRGVEWGDGAKRLWRRAGVEVEAGEEVWRVRMKMVEMARRMKKRRETVLFLGGDESGGGGGGGGAMAGLLFGILRRCVWLVRVYGLDLVFLDLQRSPTVICK